MSPVEQVECQSDFTLHAFEHRVDMYMLWPFALTLKSAGCWRFRTKSTFVNVLGNWHQSAHPQIVAVLDLSGQTSHKKCRAPDTHIRLCCSILIKSVMWAHQPWVFANETAFWPDNGGYMPLSNFLVKTNTGLLFCQLENSRSGWFIQNPMDRMWNYYYYGMFWLCIFWSVAVVDMMVADLSGTFNQ